MLITPLIRENTNYREISPGILAGPCPACGGALRLRIGMEQRRFSCTHCSVAGDLFVLAGLLGLQPSAVPQSPGLSDVVRELVAHDGRTYHITDNRTAYDQLVASGQIVFDSSEIRLVIQSGADRAQASSFLDAKQTFPGIRLSAVRPDGDTDNQPATAPRYHGKYMRTGTGN